MATKQDLQRLEAGQKSLEAKFDQTIRDNADFVNQAEIFFDEMKGEISKRIEQIQDHLGIHKN